MKKVLIVLITLLTFIVLTTGCGSSKNDYVAKVGDETITKAEYSFFLGVAKGQVQQGLFNGATVDWKQKIGDKTAEEFARQLAIDNATEYKIQLAKADEAKIDLTSKELADLNTEIDNNLKSLGSTVAEQETKIKESYLVGLTDFKSIYISYSRVQKFMKDWMSKQTYTEDELKKFYDDKLDTLKKSDQLIVWHILIITQDANKKDLPKDKIDEAQKKANDILSKVNAGEDFATLVKQYSDDPGSKDTGGEYTVSKGQMVKEFEDWAYKAKAGETGIIKTQYGFHIMKIPTFEDRKNTIEGEFLNKKFTDQMDKWKKDPKFKLVKEQEKINAIKVTE